jgi:hypothetical protein
MQWRHYWRQWHLVFLFRLIFCDNVAKQEMRHVTVCVLLRQLELNFQYISALYASTLKGLSTQMGA